MKIKKLNKDVLPFFGSMDVSAITKQTINEYLASLADRKISKSTRNKHVGVIRKVLKHASDAGILKSLPTFPTIGQDANPRSWLDQPFNHHRQVNQAMVDKAIEKWRQSPQYPGKGDEMFFNLALDLRTAGMNEFDIEQTLRSEAPNGRSPHERLAQIQSIMGSLNNSWRRAG